MKNLIGIQAMVGFMICGLLQSCYVQKGNEVHATVIHEQSSEDVTFDDTQYVETVTVEENIEPVRSLEALSTSLLLIDIQNKEKASRWEDNLSLTYYSESKSARWDDEAEPTPALIINN